MSRMISVLVTLEVIDDNPAAASERPEFWCGYIGKMLDEGLPESKVVGFSVVPQDAP